MDRGESVCCLIELVVLHFLIFLFVFVSGGDGDGDGDSRVVLMQI